MYHIIDTTSDNYPRTVWASEPLETKRCAQREMSRIRKGLRDGTLSPLARYSIQAGSPTFKNPTSRPI